MVRNTTTVLILSVLITTVGASRRFYLPLAKLHTAPKSPLPIVQQSAKQDNSIPTLTIERNMHDEQDEHEKRHALDWETLVNDEAAAIRRLFTADDRSSENLRGFNYVNSLARNTRKQVKMKIRDDDTAAAITRLSQLNENHVIKEPWIADTATGRTERLQSDSILNSSAKKSRRNDTLFLMIVGTCSFVGTLGLVAAAMFWYKIHKRAQAAADSEYPSYGITGPNSGASKISPSSTMSDRKLAQSAQMFHYQQQRQQMMAQETHNLDAKSVHSDDSDDETPAGGDYTVYECPGLAPTGEMEVRNPLFAEPDSSFSSPASASHPSTNSHYPQLSNSKLASSPPKDKFLS